MPSFGLSGALSGLSAVSTGYNAGMEEQLKLDKEKQSALAKAALGNALSSLSQQQGQGGPPSPQPPSFAQALGPQGQGGMPGGPQPQPPPPGQPSMPGGPGGPPPMGGPSGGPPPGGMPPRPMPGPGGGGGPPGAGPAMPPGPQGPPQQPGMGQPPQQQMPGGRQPLDWRTLVQAVKQSNPDIKPEVLMEAVNQFLPMMTAQSQQEWRTLSMQMREQALQQREQQFMLAEQGRNSRASQSSDDRRYGVDTRADTAAAAEGGREQRGDQRADIAKTTEAGRNQRFGDRQTQQQDQFEQREARLHESLKLREDSTYQKLEQQKQSAQQRVEASQGRQGLAEWRAAADAQYRYMRTKIQTESASTGLPKPEQKKLLDEAELQYNEQIARLRERFGRSTPTGGTTSDPSTSKVPDRVAPAGGGSPPATPAPGTPIKVTSPEEAEKLAPGTKYVTPDGKEFTR